MLFTSRESLEDLIVRLLSEGESSPLELFGKILENGKDVTIQAMYKALRYLIKSSVVVKSGKKLVVSREWADHINNAFTKTYAIPNLSEGESVHYYYKSLVNLDSYWKHLVKSLKEIYKDYPVFLYSPYGIWFHIEERQESQTGFIKEFEQQKRYGFLVIGNNTIIDKELKKNLQNDFLQVDTWQNTSFRPSEYLTVIGDYVIVTKLSKKLTSLIESTYQNLDTVTEIEFELSRILQTRDSAQIKFERNVKKAKMLRKKIFKNFYLPPEIKAQYRLLD